MKASKILAGLSAASIAASMLSMIAVSADDDAAAKFGVQGFAQDNANWAWNAKQVDFNADGSVELTYNYTDLLAEVDTASAKVGSAGIQFFDNNVVDGDDTASTVTAKIEYTATAADGTVIKADTIDFSKAWDETATNWNYPEGNPKHTGAFVDNGTISFADYGAEWDELIGYGDITVTAKVSDVVVNKPTKEIVVNPANEEHGILDAWFQFAASDWSQSRWIDNEGEPGISVPINGDGSYSISYQNIYDPEMNNPESSIPGALVFVLDIPNVYDGPEGTRDADGKKYSDENQRQLLYPGFNVTVDSIVVDGKEIPFDASKIKTGNIENQTTNYRVEIYNEYGDTKGDPGIDPALINGDLVTVNFTVKGMDEPVTLPHTETFTGGYTSDWGSQGDVEYKIMDQVVELSQGKPVYVTVNSTRLPDYDYALLAPAYRYGWGKVYNENPSEKFAWKADAIKGITLKSSLSKEEIDSAKEVILQDDGYFVYPAADGDYEYTFELSPEALQYFRTNAQEAEEDGMGTYGGLMFQTYGVVVNSLTFSLDAPEEPVETLDEVIAETDNYTLYRKEDGSIYVTSKVAEGQAPVEVFEDPSENTFDMKGDGVYVIDTVDIDGTDYDFFVVITDTDTSFYLVKHEETPDQPVEGDNGDEKLYEDRSRAVFKRDDGSYYMIDSTGDEYELDAYDSQDEYPYEYDPNGVKLLAYFTDGDVKYGLLSIETEDGTDYVIVKNASETDPKPDPEPEPEPAVPAATGKIDPEIWPKAGAGQLNYSVPFDTTDFTSEDLFDYIKAIHDADPEANVEFRFKAIGTQEGTPVAAFLKVWEAAFDKDGNPKLVLKGTNDWGRYVEVEKKTEPVKYTVKKDITLKKIKMSTKNGEKPSAGESVKATELTQKGWYYWIDGDDDYSFSSTKPDKIAYKDDEGKDATPVDWPSGTLIEVTDDLGEHEADVTYYKIIEAPETSEYYGVKALIIEDTSDNKGLINDAALDAFGGKLVDSVDTVEKMEWHTYYITNEGLLDVQSTSDMAPGVTNNNRLSEMSTAQINRIKANGGIFYNDVKGNEYPYGHFIVFGDGTEQEYSFTLSASAIDQILTKSIRSAGGALPYSIKTWNSASVAMHGPIWLQVHKEAVPEGVESLDARVYGVTNAKTPDQIPYMYGKADYKGMYTPVADPDASSSTSSTTTATVAASASSPAASSASGDANADTGAAAGFGIAGLLLAGAAMVCAKKKH